MRTLRSVGAAAAIVLALSSSGAVEEASAAGPPLQSGDRVRTRLRKSDPPVTPRVLELGF